ncbi:MAG TPA: RNA polymerase sigma factor [Aliidongia sp.]|nr:RNA polymerase sigma factor [Aliidongia sp.]
MASDGFSTVWRPSDAELVAAACSGDLSSLGLLFERYRPRLYAAALAMFGYRPEAEDAVHDTFLTALTRLGDLRDRAAVGGWLHAILRNHCLMALRRRHRRAGPEETEICFRELKEEALVESRIESQELRNWIWTALQNLPEAQRATVMLRYFGSFNSYEDLAVIMGVPIGTVRSRLHDAKVKLADLLLESAGLADNDIERVTEERRAYYAEACRSLPYGGRDAFIAHYATDVEILWRDGRQLRGRHHLEAEIDDDLSVGVGAELKRVLASGNLTIIEGIFHNPPDDPFHCPPGFVQVHFQKGGQVCRLHLHLTPRPPRLEE